MLVVHCCGKCKNAPTLSVYSKEGLKFYTNENRVATKFIDIFT